MIAVVIYIVIAILAYLLGSLNFGIIISKKFRNEDVRTQGSGNAGTTNMLRSYGKGWGALTIIGDMSKVAVAILIAFALLKVTNIYDLLTESFGNTTDILIKSFAGIFCVLGHIFPCYFKFKGGKGVATCGGMVFIIDWRIALILLVMFALTVFISKYVSLGSIIMAVFYPILIFVFHKSVILTIIAGVFALIVIVAHRENIKRLLNHTENKIGRK